MSKAPVSHIAVFQRLLSEAPSDWLRCLKAMHSCTASGVVDPSDLPIRTIFHILRRSEDSRRETWAHSLRLAASHVEKSVRTIEQKQTAPNSSHVSLQEDDSPALELAATLLESSRVLCDAVRGAVPAGGVWETALSVHRLARRHSVRLDDAVLREALIPVMEEQLSKLEELVGGSGDGETQRSALRRALQLERVELVYRSLRERPEDFFHDETSDKSVGSTSSSAVPDNTLVTLTFAARLSQDRNGEHHQAATPELQALCAAISDSVSIDVVLSSIAASVPQLVQHPHVRAACLRLCWKRIAESRSFAKERTDQAHHTSTHWGVALALLRSPVLQITREKPSFCKEEIDEASAEVLSAAYITNHVLAARVRDGTPKVMRCQQRELRKTLVELFSLVELGLIRQRLPGGQDLSFHQWGNEAVLLEDHSARQRLLTGLPDAPPSRLHSIANSQVPPHAVDSYKDALASEFRLALKKWVAVTKALDESLQFRFGGEHDGVSQSANERVRNARESVCFLWDVTWLLTTAIRRSQAGGVLQADGGLSLAASVVEAAGALLDELHAFAGALPAVELPQVPAERRTAGSKRRRAPSAHQTGETRYSHSSDWVATGVEILLLRHVLGASIAASPILSVSTGVVGVGRTLLDCMCSIARSTALFHSRPFGAAVVELCNVQPQTIAAALSCAVRAASGDNQHNSDDVSHAAAVADIAMSLLAKHFSEGSAVTCNTVRSRVVVTTLYSLALRRQDPTDTSSEAKRLDVITRLTKHATQGEFADWESALSVASWALQPIAAHEADIRSDTKSNAGNSGDSRESLAQRVLDTLTSDGAHWKEALMFSEALRPLLNEIAARKNVAAYESQRLVVKALKASQHDTSRAKERKIRFALGERLRLDLLEQLESLRRQHDWKSALEIFNEYGTQLIQSGCAYAFAFAAARNATFAEELGHHLEAVHATCSSSGAAMVAAAVAAANKAMTHSESESFQLKRRAIELAKAGIRTLPRPIPDDIASSVRAKVMDLFGNDEASAANFLAETNLHPDHEKLDMARKDLLRVLHLSRSAADFRSATSSYHAFRRSFPGCKPTVEAFLIVLQLMLSDEAISQTCSQTLGAPLPSSRVVLATDISFRNLLADANVWGWYSREFLSTITEMLLATESGNHGSEVSATRLLKVQQWCSLMRVVTDGGKSLSVSLLHIRTVLPTLLRVFSTLNNSPDNTSQLAAVASELHDITMKIVLPVFESVCPLAAAQQIEKNPSQPYDDENDVAWLVTHRTWVDVGAIQHVTEQRKKVQELLRCEIDRSLKAPQDKDDDSTRPSWVAARIASAADLWKLYRLSSSKRAPESVHAGTLLLAAVTEIRDATKLFVDESSTSSLPQHESGSERAQPNVSLKLVASLVTAWLPFCAAAVRQLFHMHYVLSLEVDVRLVQRESTTLSNSETVNGMVTLLRNVRWELTNLVKELLLLLKRCCTLETMQRWKAVSASHSSGFEDHLERGRHSMLWLYATAVQYMVNAQQLQLCRRAVESVSINMAAISGRGCRSLTLDASAISISEAYERTLTRHPDSISEPEMPTVSLTESLVRSYQDYFLCPATTTDAVAAAVANMVVLIVAVAMRLGRNMSHVAFEEYQQLNDVLCGKRLLHPSRDAQWTLTPADAAMVLTRFGRVPHLLVCQTASSAASLLVSTWGSSASTSRMALCERHLHKLVAAPCRFVLCSTSDQTSDLLTESLLEFFQQYGWASVETSRSATESSSDVFSIVAPALALTAPDRWDLATSVALKLPCPTSSSMPPTEVAAARITYVLTNFVDWPLPLALELYGMLRNTKTFATINGETKEALILSTVRFDHDVAQQLTLAEREVREVERASDQVRSSQTASACQLPLQWSLSHMLEFFLTKKNVVQSLAILYEDSRERLQGFLTGDCYSATRSLALRILCEGRPQRDLPSGAAKILLQERSHIFSALKTAAGKTMYNFVPELMWKDVAGTSYLLFDRALFNTAVAALVSPSLSEVTATQELRLPRGSMFRSCPDPSREEEEDSREPLAMHTWSGDMTASSVQKMLIGQLRLHPLSPPEETVTQCLQHAMVQCCAEGVACENEPSVSERCSSALRTISEWGSLLGCCDLIDSQKLSAQVDDNATTSCNVSTPGLLARILLCAHVLDSANIPEVEMHLATALRQYSQPAVMNSASSVLAAFDAGGKTELLLSKLARWTSEGMRDRLKQSSSVSAVPLFTTKLHNLSAAVEALAGVQFTVKDASLGVYDGVVKHLMPLVVCVRGITPIAQGPVLDIWTRLLEVLHHAVITAQRNARAAEQYRSVMRLVVAVSLGFEVDHRWMAASFESEQDSILSLQQEKRDSAYHLPLFILRGKSLSQLLRFVVLQDRLAHTPVARGAIGRVICAERSIARYCERRSGLYRQFRDAADVQILTEFFLRCFLRCRDVARIDGWSKEREELLSISYTALLDYFVVVEAAYVASSIESPDERHKSVRIISGDAVCRLLQEAFGPSTMLILTAIEATVARCVSTSAMTRGDFLWKQVHASDVAAEIAALVACHQDASAEHAFANKTHAFSASALLYFFAGRWRQVPQPLLRETLDKYTHVLRLCIGRTRGVPASLVGKKEPSELARQCMQVVLASREPESGDSEPRTAHVPLPLPYRHCRLLQPATPLCERDVVRALRLLLLVGQPEAALKMFVALYSITTLTSDVLDIVLSCALHVLSRPLDAPLQYEKKDPSNSYYRGLAVYVAWLCCSTFQSVALLHSSTATLIRVAVLVEGFRQSQLRNDMLTAVRCLFQMGATSLVDRIMQKLYEGFWLRTAACLHVAPRAVQQCIVAALSAQEVVAFATFVKTTFSVHYEPQPSDTQLLALWGLLMPKLMSACSLKPEVTATWLFDGIENVSWRRAVKMFTNVHATLANVDGRRDATLGSMTDISHKLLVAVMKSAVLAENEKNRRIGTPARSLWIQGRSLVTLFARGLCCPSPANSHRSTVLTHQYALLRFLVSASAENQWQLAFPLAHSAKIIARSFIPHTTAEEDERKTAARMAWKTRFAALTYLLSCCGNIESTVPYEPLLAFMEDFADATSNEASLLSPRKAFVVLEKESKRDAHSENVQQNSVQDDDALEADEPPLTEALKRARRALSRHPQATWADVARVWSKTSKGLLRHGEYAFPVKLALPLFTQLKRRGDYERLLLVAERLRVGPRRDKKVEALLTEAATIVAPRAVQDVLLCLSGQLAGEGIASILDRQRDVRMSEALTLTRQAMLRGSWSDALVCIHHNPAVVRASRFADAVAALVSKQRGTVLLDLMQCLLTMSESTAADVAAPELWAGVCQSVDVLRHIVQAYADVSCVFPSAHRRYAAVCSAALAALLRQPSINALDVSVMESAFSHVRRLMEPDGVQSHPSDALATLRRFLTYLHESCHTMVVNRGQLDVVPACNVARTLLAQTAVVPLVADMAMTLEPGLVAAMTKAYVVWLPTATSSSSVTYSRALLALQCSAEYADALLTNRRRFGVSAGGTTSAVVDGPQESASVLAVRDVTVFAPNALPRWLSALAVIQASHEAISQMRGAPLMETSSSYVTATLCRRAIRLAAQSGHTTVLRRAFSFLQNTASLAVIIRSVDEYCSAAQQTVGKELEGGGDDGLNNAKQLSRDAVSWLQRITDRREELRADITMEALAALLDSVAPQGHVHEDQQRIASVLFSNVSSLLSSLALTVVVDGEQSEDKFPTGVRVRLATAVLAAFGRLAALSVGTESVHKDEASFWLSSFATIPQLLGDTLGSDCLVPIAASVATAADVRMQAAACAGLLEASVVCVVADAAQSAQRMEERRAALRTLCVESMPRAQTLLAGRDHYRPLISPQMKQSIKHLCIHLHGSEWRRRWDEYTSEDVLLHRHNAPVFGASSEDVSAAESQRELLEMVSAAGTWVQAFQVLFGVADKSLTPPACEAAFRKLLHDAASSSTADLGKDKTPLPQEQVAFDFHIHLLSGDVPPTTAAIETCLQIFLLSGRAGALRACEYLRTLTTLRAAHPAPTAATTSTVARRVALPYEMKSSTLKLLSKIVTQCTSTDSASTLDDTQLAQENLSIFVRWMCCMERCAPLPSDLVAVVLLFLCATYSPSVPHYIGAARKEAVVSFLSMLAKSPNSDTLQAIDTGLLQSAAQFVLTSEQSTLKEDNELSPTHAVRVLTRVLETCAADATRLNILASTVAAYSSCDTPEAVSTLLKQLVYDCCSQEARALALAIPRTQSASVAANVWRHAAELMASYLSHAEDDAALGWSSCTLLPALHATTDLLLLCGKWKTALHYADVVSKAQCMRGGVDEYSAARVLMHLRNAAGKASADHLREELEKDKKLRRESPLVKRILHE